MTFTTKRPVVIPYKFIYKMSWFESKRHRISHTNMFYLREEDTRWGHENQLCKILVFKCCVKSNEYDSAVNNSKIIDEKRICKNQIN